MSVKTANQFRLEEDALGNVQVPAEHLWGAQTQRSHMNFPIGVERFRWGRSAKEDDPSNEVLQSEDAISTVATATPSSTSMEVFVPRRRFQRGRLFVRGSRKKVWVGSFREDQVQPDASIKRIRRSVVLGETARVSRRAALATLQPFLDRVNIAPPPLPKSGKTLLEAVADWRIGEFTSRRI